MFIYPTQATAPRTAPRRELLEGTAREPQLDKYNYKAKAKSLQALDELDYIHYT